MGKLRRGLILSAGLGVWLCGVTAASAQQPYEQPYQDAYEARDTTRSEREFGVVRDWRDEAGRYPDSNDVREPDDDARADERRNRIDERDGYRDGYDGRDPYSGQVNRHQSDSFKDDRDDAAGYRSVDPWGGPERDPYRGDPRDDAYDRGTSRGETRISELEDEIPGIVARLKRQNRRIRSGLDKGLITPSELKRIRVRIERIEEYMRHARADGFISWHERRRIHRMLDRSSRLIARVKYLDDDRYARF